MPWATVYRFTYNRRKCQSWIHVTANKVLGVLMKRQCFVQAFQQATYPPVRWVTADDTAWWVTGCLPCSLLGGSPSIYNGLSVRILLSNNLPLYGHLALIEIFLATGRQRRTAGVQERAKHIYFGWCVVVCDRHGGEPLFQRQHLYLRCTFLRLDSTNNAK